MKGIPGKSIAILCAMVLAAGLAFAAKPRTRVADQSPKVDLEVVIPKTFGNWKLDERVVPILPSPDAKAVLDRIYSQTVSRTYVNESGERVMLSVAYGGEQSDSMQVHRPEVCYPAQGFSVLKSLKGVMETQFGQLPIRRLVASQGPRVEPITYWITVGDQVARSNWEQKLAQLSYGLTGKVPDGLLFRISTIDRDEQRAYSVQEAFVRELLAQIDADARVRLVGRLGQS